MSSEIGNQTKQDFAPASAVSSVHRVGAWYAAPSRMLQADLSGRTLRQIVHLHAGGEKLRLRLSNRYGGGPVTLASIPVGQHPAYDSGDGTHPNNEGYKLMAEVVDISLLTASPDKES